MAFTALSVDLKLAISGEEPLPHAHNLANGYFLPDLLVLLAGGGPLSVVVSGPLLRNGKPLKTRRGLVTFDQEDIDAGQVPGWVAEAVQSCGSVLAMFDKAPA